MKISMIAAMSENRVIGRRNALPWSIPEDLKHFRAVTAGHSVIMGRKTHESIGRLLPGRQNIIVTRNRDYRVEGAVVVNSLESAIEAAREVEKSEIFIIGGGELYSQGLALADRIYLTLVHETVEGDAWFPELPEGEWSEKKREKRDAPLPFSFLEFERA